MPPPPMSFPDFLLLLAFLIGGGALLYNLLAAVEAGMSRYRASRTDRNARTLDLSRRISSRLEALLEDMKRFDLEAGTAPPSAGLARARQIRGAAVDPFAAAGEAFLSATRLEDLEEVEGLTGEAETLMMYASAHLDQALGRESLNSLRLYPAPAPAMAGDCGFCFFCSLPAPLEALQPVRIRTEGVARGVLACKACHRLVHGGRTPSRAGLAGGEGDASAPRRIGPGDA